MPDVDRRGGQRLTQTAVVRAAIERGIADGSYGGRMLPTLACLAREHGVSPSTVRLALQPLKDGGVLRSRRGIGTFVAGRLGSPGGQADGN